ncbi:hypothetical protein HYPSUDRAFT_126973, partial [Hypholoma sublateritium FD-334 SS-4]
PTKDCAYTVKEKINTPHGWVLHGQPAPHHTIELKVALPQPNFDELERHLYEVSDPDHQRYGQHLSKEEVEQLVAPRPASLDAVNTWLGTFGYSEDEFTRSPAKDWISLKVPVSVAEKMLDTKYHVWKHIDSGDFLVRTTSYSLPKHLHDHIELIQPTTMFGRFKPEKSTVYSATRVPSTISQDSSASISTASGISVDASCNSTITITCLQQLYNAVGFTPSAKGNSIGITGYLDQFANFQDLQSFFASERPDALNSTFKVLSVSGGQNNQSLSEAGDEANLDTQFAFGISHPISPTFFTTAGEPPFIPEEGETQADNSNDPPLAISTSYGDDEQTVPFSFAQRVCAGFAQLGARGVSLMFSSGDGGVGDGDSNPATQTCFSNDGRNITKFLPAFPASSVTFQFDFPGVY